MALFSDRLRIGERNTREAVEAAAAATALPRGVYRVPAADRVPRPPGLEAVITRVTNNKNLLPPFKRGIRIGIRNWLELFEATMRVQGVGEEEYVDQLITRIDPEMYVEIKARINEPYPRFKAMMLERFEDGALGTTSFHALRTVV
jgi:hypothetical protein